MVNLSQRNKAECKVSFALVIVALLLQRVDKETKSQQDNPAVKQCITQIDELFAGKDAETRKAMENRINLIRTRFTKKVSNIGTTEGLIGSIRVLTGGLFRTRAGTRFDYIVITFRNNLSNMEKTLSFKEQDAKIFEKELRKAIQSI